MPSEDCILFEHFVKLLHSISRVPPRPVGSSHSPNVTPRSLVLVERWFAEVRKYYSTIPSNTCRIVFRLLFPEEDVRRRYNLKETTLARSLAVDVFGLSISGAGRILIEWSDYPNTFDKAKLGCLGTEVEKILSGRHSVRQGQSPSIQAIDNLLDELASLSGYSNLGNPVSPSKRPRVVILRDLFLNLNPAEAKFLTQIILKDLRPVLYPLTETHSTRALLHYKSNAVHMLSKWEVMKAWNPWMPKVYRARATLDEAASTVETLPFASNVSRDHEAFFPVLGVPIEVPKSRKGVKLSHALNFFQDHNSGDVWAETKYDGERMQIHINLSLPACHQIKIFSKSKRDSTLDRMGTHPIIRAAMSLPPLPEDYLLYPVLGRYANKESVNSVLTSVVLDAEMVCYTESKRAIDEFWRLRSLIESTALGVRGPRRQNKKPNFDSQESRGSDPDECSDVVVESLQSNASDNGDRHFHLVFFDILSLNGFSLLDQDYATRRAQLERLIKLIPGYVSLSSRQLISTSGRLSPAAMKVLAKVFSEHIANHQEGLVLKTAKSRYNDNKLPWVKLKRDYIPGYGDTVDLVILGAGWNKDRARELRVSPETFTSFFVAALENPFPAGDSTDYVPQFHVLFSVEYGMDREQLEALNMYIKTSNIHPFRDKMADLPYSFKLPQHAAKPAFMFSRPLLVELFGAGFSKDPGSKYYSLRFPRITKVWWTNDRNWAEGSRLEEYQNIARLSIGNESSEAWAKRTVEAMWGCNVDAGPKDPQKIAAASSEWRKKLIELDMLPAAGADSVPRFSGIHTQIASSSRRKVPPTGATGSPAKRRKFQANRLPSPSLRALCSVTNLMNVDTGARKGMPSNTTLVPTKHHHAKHKVPDFQRTCHMVRQDDSTYSMTLKQTEELREKPSIIPSVTPTALHSSSDALQLPTPTDRNKNLQVTCSTVPKYVESSVPPVLSKQVPSDKVLFGKECGLVKFLRPYWPQKYFHTPVVQFLQNAYVWIPRDEGNKRPIDRPPALDLVPQNRRIAVMYFLLIICGCRVSDVERGAKQFTHVDKCVIFVNTGHDTEVVRGLTWLFDALESWREDLNKPGRKELFVLDSGMIRYDSLATFSGDVTSHALWRSSKRFHHSTE